jgi:hypothetical protein
VRGFGFVDICHKPFDVVLMNPPFGDSSQPAKATIEEPYPRTENDLYAALVEQETQPARRSRTARSDHFPHGILPLVIQKMAGRRAARECRSYRVCRY